MGCVQDFPFPHSQKPNTPPQLLLTNNRQDDHHEVEDVPADGEVVVAQGHHLEHALAREQHDEHQVDPVQHPVHVLALVVRLHHHGDHVQADEDHDDDVKGLLGDAVEHEALERVLKGGRGRGVKRGVMFFLW